MEKLEYDALIIAAGNGTRMGNMVNVPKALVDVNNRPNIFYALDELVTRCRNIYVISNKRNVAIFDEFIGKYIQNNKDYAGRIINVPIESGRGDGHAVMVAMNAIQNLSEKFFVIWGDVHISNGGIFDECINYDNAFDVKPMLIPVALEEEPYVTFLVNEEMKCQGVDFSKRGESHNQGFHDQCVFLCCQTCVRNSLDILEAAYNKNGRYITDSGELTFLYLIHYFANIDFHATAMVTEYPQNSYNTPDELKRITAERK